MSNPTIADANEWNATPEKYTFCIDWLDASAWDDDADERVFWLEAKFEFLLENGQPKQAPTKSY